jgi:hypothetical protein
MLILKIKKNIILIYFKIKKIFSKNIRIIQHTPGKDWGHY